LSTECNFKDYEFQALGRSVVANFSDGKITTEGGGLLFGEVEERRRIVGRFAKCFTDYRDARTVEHTVQVREDGLPLLEIGLRITKSQIERCKLSSLCFPEMP